MALRKVGTMACQMAKSSRQLHTASSNNFIFQGLFASLIPNKPMLSDEALAVGYEKHEMLYANHPADPLNVKYINYTYVPAGKGTKNEPFLVPSMYKERLCKVDMGDEDFDLPEFLVTLEKGGRCPVTGAHYKLDYHPEWATIEYHV